MKINGMKKRYALDMRSETVAENYKTMTELYVCGHRGLAAGHVLFSYCRERRIVAGEHGPPRHGYADPKTTA